MNKLKIGIVGVGFIGKQHIESIGRIHSAEVIAVCETDAKLARSIADELGIPLSFGSVDDMINSVNLDVIHNCTPSNMHHSINKKILSAGINVYCEKPLTLNSQDSEALIQLVAEKNVKAAVNFNYRHNAMVEEMKERIKNKAIGDVWYIATDYLQDWLLKQSDFDWRIETKYSGFTRAISDIGSHCFDTLQYILGEKITAVRAKRYILHPERQNKQGKTVVVENEDAALIQVRFESGIEAVVRVSQVTAGKKNHFTMLVEGTQAALAWDQEIPDRLWIGHRDSGNEELFADAKYLTGRAKDRVKLPNGHAAGWTDAFTNGIRYFYDSIIDPGADVNYTDFTQAHHIMKVIDACIESDNAQEWRTV